MFEVVGWIGSVVDPARGEVPNRDTFVTYPVDDDGLRRIEIVDAQASEFILDRVHQDSVGLFKQVDCIAKQFLPCLRSLRLGIGDDKVSL